MPLFSKRFAQLVAGRLGLPEDSEITMAARQVPWLDLDEVEGEPEMDDGPLDLDELRTRTVTLRAAPGVLFVRIDTPQGEEHYRAIALDDELEQAMREAP